MNRPSLSRAILSAFAGSVVALAWNNAMFPARVFGHKQTVGNPFRERREKYPGQHDYRRHAGVWDGVPSRMRQKERKARTR